MARAMGPHPLWLAEWLAEAVPLAPGARVLDLGCGRGITSIFLAREYGVRVHAADGWENADGKWDLIRAHGLEDRVIPLRADARDLPFAEGYFDAVLGIDSFLYFAHEPGVLDGIARTVRPGGHLGMVTPGFSGEIAGELPARIAGFLGGERWTWRTLGDWVRLWRNCPALEIHTADALGDGCGWWLRWEEALADAGLSRHPGEIGVFREDRGECIGLLRVVATKKCETRAVIHGP